MENVATPLLDASIQAGRAVWMERWNRAKTALRLAVENGVIYNPEFESAKHSIVYGCELALRPLCDAFYASYRALPLTAQNLLEPHDVASYVSPREAVSYIRKNLRCVAMPEVAIYVEHLKEMVPLHNALQEARAFIVKGRRPAINPKVEDLSNTGICAICNRRQKLGAGQVLVDHGFKISLGDGRYLGHRNGPCFGVGYQPYELSCEANKKYIPCLENALAEYREALHRHQSGQTDRLKTEKRVWDGINAEYVTVWVGRDEPWFASLLQSAIYRVESDICYLKTDLETQQAKVTNWAPQPLFEAPVRA